jgi:cell wall-associated NlpC family hydrolase
VIAAAMLGASLVTVVPGTAAAGADPLGSERAQAAALAQKISSEQAQVESLSNQYDGAELHLTQVRAQVETARSHLAAATARAAQIRAQVTHEAVKEYTSGGFQPRVTQMASTNIDPLVAQSYFQMATGDQTDALDQYRSAERALADQQQSLARAEKVAAGAADALAGRRQAVTAAQAQAQGTLSGVNGQIATLVAQAQAQAEAKQKAAELAAYHAQVAAQQRAGALAVAAAAQNAANSSSGLQAVKPATTAAPAPVVTPFATSPATAAPGTVAPVNSAPVNSAPSAPAPPAPVSIPSRGGGASTAVSVALAQVGKPYQWGAAGPDSFDCSGLVMYAYAAAGVSLPHYTGSQWADTTQIPLADAQPGDLIFFNGLQHVGIYLGGGSMVDAPHTGADVRVESIFGFGSIDGATRVG